MDGIVGAGGHALRRQRVWAALIGCLMAVGSVWAAGQGLPLDHWAYDAMVQLQRAGLLENYPAAWIESGHVLTRHEFAYYIRGVLLHLGRLNGDDPRSSLSSQAEAALSRLASEFAAELHALGVNVRPWTERAGQSGFIDLDELLRAIEHRPEVPPAIAPPAASEPAMGSLTTGQAGFQIGLPAAKTIQWPTAPLAPLRIPLHDFGGSPRGLMSLAGEVLGAEWTLKLDAEAYQDLLGVPLRVGGFLISDEQTAIQGGFGLRVGDQLGLGFDALWFLDLDLAQTTMDRLLLDVSTKVDLSQRLGVFGKLTVDYRPELPALTWMDSQASAGLRVLLGGDLYFIAKYSLSNPFDESLSHLQGPALGLSVGDIGLILLGMQTTDLTDLNSLELTGEFVYRF